MSKEDLVFLPLGGSGEIGMNMNLYGVGTRSARKWIMIDCGVTFGGPETPGVDLIMPDPSYILEFKDDLLALFLTHAHEDHIGAVAHIAPMLDCPVYATPFTAELVKSKLEEADAAIDLRVIEMGARLKVGPFDLEYVTLTHSIPEPNAIAIRTALGNVLHTGDWKLDDAPSLGPVTDAASLEAFGAEGVECIVCDSTNVLSPGESGSESAVQESLKDLISQQPNRVFVATFASNVGRVLSICKAAAAADRSVCLLGRSMLRIVRAAKTVGILPESLKFVEPRDAGFLPKEHVLYLCTGSQGEPRAALSRIARDDHPEIAISEGDTVIFSSKIIPGNEREIYDLQNLLVDLGAGIITERDAFIHVSGHPNQGELARMYGWAKPRLAIPVHGEARHLEFHADFARRLGVEDSLAPRNGDLIRIAPGGLALLDEAPSGRLYLDGKILVPEGGGSIRERKKLGWAGVAHVAVAIDKAGRISGEVVARCIGAPPIDGEPLEDLIAEAVEDALDDLPASKRRDVVAVETTAMRAARQAAVSTWGKRPAVLVSVILV
ncbi:MAG: MBL fold metallo-hydrolase [Alphaproteobacteria bacterium]|nr:MBL fold metallo-hydrolase [Alphaproteobacteria bacterium]